MYNSSTHTSMHTTCVYTCKDASIPPQMTISYQGRLYTPNIYWPTPSKNGHTPETSSITVTMCMSILHLHTGIYLECMEQEKKILIPTHNQPPGMLASPVSVCWVHLLLQTIWAWGPPHSIYQRVVRGEELSHHSDWPPLAEIPQDCGNPESPLEASSTPAAVWWGVVKTIQHNEYTLYLVHCIWFKNHTHGNVI